MKQENNEVINEEIIEGEVIESHRPRILRLLNVVPVDLAQLLAEIEREEEELG